MASRSTWRLGVVVAALSAAMGASGGCGGESRPAPFTQPTPSGGTGGTQIVIDSGSGGAPRPDAPGLCGQAIQPIAVERPNLYFVLDVSGSMGAEISTNQTRYSAVRSALRSTLLRLGHRVNYGAAVYPEPPGTEQLACSPGEEIFPLQPGDPPSYWKSNRMGHVLTRFDATLAGIVPNGGTPTAAALGAAFERLRSEPGRSFVVLATDGAPNCGTGLSCSASRCLLNLEGYYDGVVDCRDPSFNCCDETNVRGGSAQCIADGPSVDAVRALYAAGIPTYVIGLPGTELYGNVLDSLAIAGGSARSGTPKYYPTTSQDDLEQALLQIGVTLTVSCDIDVTTPLEERGEVNVYFDQRVVPFDPENGWDYVDDDTVRLVGAACAELKGGDVAEVQVAVGCATVVQ